MSKSITQNSLFNIIYKGFTVLFPLVTATYVSHILLAEGVGKVAYANTVVSYFTLLASLGIPNYGIKVIAKNGSDLEARSKTFFELLVLNAISTTIFLFLYYIFILSVPHFDGRHTLFFAMGIMIFLNYFNVDWFYQGVEEYKYIALRGILVKTVSFILVIVFVNDSGDYVKYALIICLATAGNNILNIIHIHKFIIFKKYKLVFGLHLKPVLILLASTIATEVYTMLDTVMLEYYHGETYVGYYSNSVKIVRMVFGLAIALVATIFPRISYYLSENQIDRSNALLEKAFHALLVIVLPSIIGLFCMSDSIVKVLFGESFIPAIVTLKILSILIAVFSVAYLFGHIILMATSNEKLILVATVCGAVINVIVNVILIPMYKQNGAAVASVIAELLVTIVLVYYSHKYFSINLSIHSVITIIISSLGMLFGILLFRIFITNPLIQLVVIIPASIIIYLGLLVAFGNPIIKKYLLILRKLLH